MEPIATDPSNVPRSADPSLSLRLFGPMEVRYGGALMPPLRTRRGYWLIALLALAGGRAVERTWLAGTLWPESPDGRALYNLRRTLSDLRAALGSEARRLISPAGHTVALNLEGADVDLVAFDAAIRRGDPPSLETALGLYTAPLLEGIFEPWALSARQSRERSFLECLERLSTEARSSGDLVAAARHLRRLVETDPLRECAQRDLMEVLGACGDLSAVEAAYRRFCAGLAHDLGTEPAPETQATYRHFVAASSRRASGVAPRPSLRSSLPRPLTPLIGRERELRDLRAAMARGRLVTLTGIGGVGKTRLAIEVASEWLGGSDGVAFVDLGSLHNSSLVRQTVATALGHSESELPGALQGRRLCLVLDTCERQIDGCAPLAAELLQACPELRILATSRRSLGLVGETVWPVQPLALPPGGAPFALSAFDRVDFSAASRRVPTGRGTAVLDREAHSAVEAVIALAGYDAVRLFIDRAVAAQPGFELTPLNAAAVVRICRRLDGIPLAIEFAAARIAGMSALDIERRLDNCFDWPGRPLHGVPPRHQTLRATLSWSCDLLPEAEWTLLDRLSVFEGAFTLEAVQAICADDAGPSTVERLACLVDQSLVRVASDGGAASYSLLDTTREYVRERVDAGEGYVRVRDRHAAYFLDLSERARSACEGPDEGHSLDQLDATLHNLRAALDWLVNRGRDADIQALRMVGALGRFWWVRGYRVEGRAWLERALAATKRSAAIDDPDWARARLTALQEAAGLIAAEREFAAALALFDEAIELCDAIGDRRERARALRRLGQFVRQSGDLARSIQLLEESLSLWRALGDRWGMGATLAGLGTTLQAQGELDAARVRLEEGAGCMRAVGDRLGAADCLTQLGILARQRKDAREAQVLLEEALDLYRANKHENGMAWTLHALAGTYRDLGERDAAHAAYVQALVLFRDQHAQSAMADCLLALAELAAADDAVRAAHLFGAVQSLREAIGEPIEADEARAWDERLTPAREALGKQRFDAAIEHGRGMSADGIVEQLLA